MLSFCCSSILHDFAHFGSISRIWRKNIYINSSAAKQTTHWPQNSTHLSQSQHLPAADIKQAATHASSLFPWWRFFNAFCSQVAVTHSQTCDNSNAFNAVHCWIQRNSYHWVLAEYSSDNETPPANCLSASSRVIQKTCCIAVTTAYTKMLLS